LVIVTIAIQLWISQIDISTVTVQFLISKIKVFTSNNCISDMWNWYFNL